MPVPDFELVLRIANRQITEHLSWEDLLWLSRTSPLIKYIIIYCCAPFEGDIVRMCYGRSGDGGPSQDPNKALKQLTELPVAARLFLTGIPPNVFGRIAEAIENCGRINHISFPGGGFVDLIHLLSPTAAGRITSIDLVSTPSDGSRLTSKSLNTIYVLWLTCDQLCCRPETTGDP